MSCQDGESVTVVFEVLQSRRAANDERTSTQRTTEVPLPTAHLLLMEPAMAAAQVGLRKQNSGACDLRASMLGGQTEAETLPPPRGGVKLFLLYCTW